MAATRNPQCFLADVGVHQGGEMPPCDGRLVRCHLIKRQVLTRAARSRGVDPDAWIADERTWVPGCGGPMGNGGHHGMLDQTRTLRLPAEHLPPGLVEFAREAGLEWYLTREYGIEL
jgi:hypothetical protein